MLEIDELVSLYAEAEAHHAALFAEQRSNLLLVAGLHYNKKDSRFWRRVRDMESITKQQRIRLTKNHTQKITKTYINNLLNAAPGVAIGPKNESELSDQKSAEMHSSVWRDLKSRHELDKLNRQWIQDLVEIGEAWAKVIFDPSTGDFLGYDELFDEETGEASHDPRFTGGLVYERIHGFNVLTDPDARSETEVRYHCIRKMVPIKDLKAQVGHDEEKLALISKSSDETYRVFDSASGNYGSSEGLTLVMEWYFRPCADYPTGYYVIATKAGKLFEGELPKGVYPIVFMGFDEVSTSARAYSIIKQLRPCQAEVNRAASCIAETQMTLGSDKLVLLNGSSMSPGGMAHGTKAIKVTGMAPTIMPGRSGEQYVAYMNANISEMYSIAAVAEDSQEKASNNLDPYNMLFRTASQKKQYSLYVKKVQEFQIKLCQVSLRLAKIYYPDEILVPVVGRKEHVNIPEFRNSDDLSHEIIVEGQSEDLESRMGRQLALNHLVQYAGPNMSSEDLGKIVRSMEYINKEALFDDSTIDYDNASSDILALDRGEWVPPSPEDNHAYLLKRLSHRKKQKDFRALPPQVQQMYEQKIAMHRQLEAQQIQQAQLASSGFIPSGGMLVSIDFYTPDPVTGKAKRVRLPSEAVQWLVSKLAAQGSSQEMLQEQDLETQARVGEILQLQRQQPQQGPDQGSLYGVANF
jgi:hypothetical protein